MWKCFSFFPNFSCKDFFQQVFNICSILPKYFYPNNFTQIITFFPNCPYNFFQKLFCYFVKSFVSKKFFAVLSKRNRIWSFLIIFVEYSLSSRLIMMDTIVALFLYCRVSFVILLISWLQWLQRAVILTANTRNFSYLLYNQRN